MGLVREVSRFSFNDLKVRPRAIKFLDGFVTPQTFLAIMRFKANDALTDLGLNYFVNYCDGKINGSSVLLLGKDMILYAASMGEVSVVGELQNALDSEEPVKILREALVEARYIDEDHEVLVSQQNRIMKLFGLDTHIVDYSDRFFINGRIWDGGLFNAERLRNLHEEYENNRFTSAKCEEVMKFLNEALNEKYFKRADWYIFNGDVGDEQQYYDVVWPVKDFLSNNNEYVEKIKKILDL